jgi:hypothetical protein
MNRSKILSSVRIALSAIFLLACATFTTLWVRSYWRSDVAVWGFTPVQGIVLRSLTGAVTLNYLNFSGQQVTLYKWHVDSTPVPDNQRIPFGGIDGTFAGFLIRRSGPSFIVCVPYWFLVPLSAALPLAQWRKHPLRFSLRTMLVTITLTALVLGAVVIAAQ